MEIIIPTSLKDIKLKELMAYELSDKSNISLVKHICNVENPKLIPIKEYKELVSHLKELLKSDVEFEKIFTYDGIEFGFVPKIEALSGEEFIDVDEYIKSPKDWNKALSVLYRPVIKRKRNWFKKNAHDLYDIKAYNGTDEWSELMLEVPCVYYLGAMVFFYNLGNDLLNDMKAYSQEILQKKQKAQV